ncbi:glycosyltransferase [Desulfovibrio sp. UCD-KL4C]|uniref:glycosyltransferase n=1 Tax=Desulfovibrio sp. UCD-KL4C TaxID=2578120 RepID=UPI0025C186A2|nr:glycosyltransferase [Desulfovibrio sp. UCD-KL4C]
MRAVVLVIPVLCMGGAEKVLTQMANWWARQGVTVYLITFNSKNDFFCLDRSIIKYNIDEFPISKEVSSVWTEEKNNIGRLRTVFQKILNERPERPLPIISFLSRMNLRTLLAAEGLPCNVVVSERIMPSRYPLSPKEEGLRKGIYHKAQKVVCVSELIHKFWANKLLSLSNSLFIHNFILPQDKTEEQNFHFPDRFILFAGRLEPQKQVDKLITVFSMLKREERLKLVIAGDGSLRSKIERQISDLKLENEVQLLGKISNVQQVATKASCFVLTSKFEGFPNVLLEVMGVGCPVVAFDCETGPSEIIRDGKDGFLVPVDNLTMLKEKIEKILSSPRLHRGMSEATKEVYERFSQEKIMCKWESLFRS